MRIFVDENGFLSTENPYKQDLTLSDAFRKERPQSKEVVQSVIQRAPSPASSNGQAKKSAVASGDPNAASHPEHVPAHDKRVLDAQHRFQQAIGRGDAASVEVQLKDNGGLVHVRTISGQTPLHCAVLKGNLSVVRLLVRYRADLFATDDYGLTPLQLAQSLGQPGYVDILCRSVRSAANAVNLTPGFQNNKGRLVVPRPRSVAPDVRISCPQCGVMVVKLERHLKKIHMQTQVPCSQNPASSAKAAATECGFRPYPHCGVMVVKLERHLKRVHAEAQVPRSAKPVPSRPRIAKVERGDAEDLYRDVSDFDVRDSIGDGSRGWGHAWRDHGSYGSHPGFDSMDDDSDAG